MKKTVLREYAKLIAKTGVNVQKGQEVFITAELDQPEFVTMVADACYHAGARKVTVTWKHQALEKLAIRRESVRTLRTVADWERAKLQHYVDTLPCRIYLLCTSELLKFHSETEKKFLSLIRELDGAASEEH